MKIILCASDFETEQKANLNIIVNIAKELTCNNFFVYIAGYGNISEKNNDNINYISTKKYYENNISKNDGIFKYLINEILKFITQIKYIIKILENLNKDDIVLSVYSPFINTYILSKFVKNNKFIAYQLDPYGLHELLSKKNKNIRIRMEKKLFDKSSLIITTKCLYEQYKENKYYKKYIEKIIFLEFPLLVNRRNICIDNNYNDIVYLGSIDDMYRNPNKILYYLIKIIEKYNLSNKIIFYGQNKSRTLDEYIKKYNGIVFYKGIINYEQATKIINSNVILLNINNNMKNQMPSKLIEYISSGNPIINVIKKSDESSAKILDKYKNNYNFYEDKINNEDLFVKFLEKNNIIKIDFNSVNNSYLKCTPNYFVKILKEHIMKQYNF